MNEIAFESAGVLGKGFMEALFLTTRCRRIGDEHYLRFREAGEPVIFVLWHGHLFPLVHYHRNEGVVVLVSQHADGEYITRVLKRQGFGTVRGSSTRGGIRGLKGLIREARAGHDLALTPDGPRGPAREVKPGALLAAQMTGHPIIPVAVRASRAWHFDSWDRFMVPRPFARLEIEYAAPVRVPRHVDEEERLALARRVQASLDRMSEPSEPGDPSEPGQER